MKLIAGLTILAATLAVGVPIAGADGSPYAPGLVYGASGVRAPKGALRYVTLSTSHSTVVAAIGVRSGKVVRSSVLPGFYGIPLVAFDNSTGGLSGNRKRLILASYGPQPGTAGSTSFAVLSTRMLATVRRITLRGSWAFDAVSPDASRIYLIEYLAAGQSPHYRVRLLSLQTGRLDPKPVVDRTEQEVEMRGQPVTRATSAGGRWAYTLYARTSRPPFIHALDTATATAHCIDLPLPLAQLEQMSLRLRVGPTGGLVVLNGRRVEATIDTRSLTVLAG